MKLEGTIHCDGPDCEHHWRAGLGRWSRDGKLVSLPPGFVQVQEFNDQESDWFVFCGWDCAMKFGAQRPAEEEGSWSSWAGPFTGEGDDEGESK